jgi:hypothetical protein
MVQSDHALATSTVPAGCSQSSIFRVRNMRVRKFKNNEIVKLLEVYERYEILWGVLCDEYANTTKRQTAFNVLIEEMRDRAFQDISLEMLVKKINKTVYQQELARTVKSNKAALEQKKSRLVFEHCRAARASTSSLVSEMVNSHPK